MRKTMFNNADGELITLYQTCERANLGMTTVRRLAEESGAIRKIGKSIRVNKKQFFDFIESNFSQ